MYVIVFNLGIDNCLIIVKFMFVYLLLFIFKYYAYVCCTCLIIYVFNYLNNVMTPLLHFSI